MSTGGAELGIWVVSLGAKVRELRRNVDNFDIEALEKSLNTRRAELLHLYEYAKLHNLEIAAYYHPFVDIQDQLSQLAVEIESRKRPWWRRALAVIVPIVSFIGSLFGLDLTPIVRRLSDGPKRLLSSGDDGS